MDEFWNDPVEKIADACLQRMGYLELERALNAFDADPEGSKLL